MFDKKEYWEHRKDGKRGQDEVMLTTVSKPSEVEVTFGNDGRLIVKNRAYRRAKIKLKGWSDFTRKRLNKIERKAFRKKGRH